MRSKIVSALVMIISSVALADNSQYRSLILETLGEYGFEHPITYRETRAQCEANEGDFTVDPDFPSENDLGQCLLAKTRDGIYIDKMYTGINPTVDTPFSVMVRVFTIKNDMKTASFAGRIMHAYKKWAHGITVLEVVESDVDLNGKWTDKLNGCRMTVEVKLGMNSAARAIPRNNCDRGLAIQHAPFFATSQSRPQIDD